MILEISVNLEGPLTMIIMGSLRKAVHAGLIRMIMMTILMLTLMLKICMRLLKKTNAINL